MGNGFIPCPFADCPVPVMDLDGQGEAEGLGSVSNQYTNRTKEMSMDERGLGCRFGLLNHLFYAGHIFSVSGPFCPIANQDSPAGNLPEWRL